MRLEGNLPDMAALHGMWGAISALEAATFSQIESLVRASLPDLSGEFTRLGLRPRASSQATGTGIATFVGPPDRNLLSLQARLRHAGVVVAASENSIRIALHTPNSPADIDALIREVTYALRG
jgi:hypothetical protein